MQTTGYWTFNTGIEVGGHLQIDDDNKIKLGTSGDLEIYHNGSNSFIDDTGTGNLQIRGSSQVKIQKYTGENMFVGIADGAASMYHDNSQRIATTADGVDITATGALRLPVGTTAERPSSPAQGDLRFSSTDTAAEVYNGTAWAAVGGGATGGGSDAWVVETDQTVTTSYELSSGKHGTTVSPTINSGATITVPSGAILVIL